MGGISHNVGAGAMLREEGAVKLANEAVLAQGRQEKKSLKRAGHGAGLAAALPPARRVKTVGKGGARGSTPMLRAWTTSTPASHLKRVFGAGGLAQRSGRVGYAGVSVGGRGARGRGSCCV
jgi:hypothetical protein